MAISRAAWKVVGGEGYGRVDLRIDEAGRPWILEVNANPDISPDAGLARMAGVAGIDYPTLIRRICESAIAAKTENELERWAKTLALSGMA